MGKKEICGVLYDSGRRCRRPAVAREQYHGDDELYDWNVEYPKVWVSVPMCWKHLSPKVKPKRKRASEEA